METSESLLAAIETLKKEFEAGIYKYSTYGVRFDDRNFKEGDKLGNSKSNIDREDPRDFPEYGTEEYDNLPTLGGTCAYYVYDGDRGKEALGLSEIVNAIKSDWIHHNWYLIGSDNITDEEEDANEVVMVDARVICKL